MAVEHERGEIVVEHHGDATLLRLRGEHDTGNVAAVNDAIGRSAGEGCGVVVSLSAATFIDSTVIRALASGDQELVHRGRRLVLHVATHDIVRRVLVITGLTERLPTSGSLEEAFALSARETDA